MTDSVRRAVVEKDQPSSAVAPERRPDVFAPKEPLCATTQRRLAVLQQLQAHEGKPSYGAERSRAVSELSISDRHLYRLQRDYEREGVQGLKSQGRSDAGQFRVDEDWQAFIVETYQAGNRGER